MGFLFKSAELEKRVIEVLPFCSIGLVLNICYGFSSWKRANVSYNLRSALLTLCFSNLLLLITFPFIGMSIDFKELHLQNVTNNSCLQNGSAFLSLLINQSNANQSDVGKEFRTSGIHVSFFKRGRKWACLIPQIVQETLMNVTLLSVLSISLERLLSVRKIRIYKTFYTKTKVQVQTLLVWFLGLAISLTVFIYYDGDCVLEPGSKFAWRKNILIRTVSIHLVLVLIIDAISLSIVASLNGYKFLVFNIRSTIRQRHRLVDLKIISTYHHKTEVK